MTYAIFTAIFLVVFVAGFGCGWTVRGARCVHIFWRQRRLHTAQLIKARIFAKIEGSTSGQRALVVRMTGRGMPKFWTAERGEEIQIL